MTMQASSTNARTPSTLRASRLTGLLGSCLVPALLASFVGCNRQQGLTSEEANEAKEELQLGTASQALTSKSIEITTNFTIGGAVEKAADELRQFYQSQWACADVQLSGHTLTVEYGAHGICPYNN